MGHYPKQTDPKMFQAHQPETEPNRGVVPLDPQSRGGLTPINAIRTEIIFSRLPIHQLSRKHKTDIRIHRRDAEGGQLTFRWEVSYNDHFGAPRKLAYRFDKQVLDRRLDELGSPLPNRYVRLDSLRAIARQLGLGGDTDKAKKVIHQNASTYIVAKLVYKTRDGHHVEIEQGFNRYSVIFRKEKLPDGSEADGVFIKVLDPLLHVLNTAPRRPLDRDYHDQLSKRNPAAARFYEISGPQFFAALKHGHFEARLRYSEYSQQAPQACYHERAPAQKQMHKVHRPHIESGYIAKARWQKTTDDQGRLDWFIHYTPGPKAFVEYQTFTGKVPKTRRAKASITVAQPKSQTRKGAAAAVESTVGPKRLSALTTRGVVKTEALKFLSGAPRELLRHIDDSLEYFDSLPRDGIMNAGAFLAELVRKNISIPETFETSRRRGDREAREQEQQRWQDQEARLRIQYRQDCEHQLEQYIATNRQKFTEQIEAETARSLEALRPYKQMPADLKQRNALTTATGKVRSAIAERICPAFEDWKRGHLADISAAEASQPQPPEKSGSDKPLNPSPDPSERQTTRQ